MKILLFHPVLLPPKNYGGTERIVLWLARGLVEAGHQVWVAASPGSTLPKGVSLIEVPPKRSSPELFAKDLLALGRALNFDVIHFHTPVSETTLKLFPSPSLLTIHGNGKAGELFPKNTVFLSQDHARRHQATEYVYNGIDPSEYVFAPAQKTDRFLFLSKTSWKVKNVRGAIRLCRKSKVHLTVAGGHGPIIENALARFSKYIHWQGPVSGTIKAQLLAQAKALVFPVLWPEPFGLVVVEALISGTPVVAARLGSLPELVTPDVGALLTEEAQWLEFLNSKVSFEPEVCRNRALSHFHFHQMTEKYLIFYKKVCSGLMLHTSNPIGLGWQLKKVKGQFV